MNLFSKIQEMLNWVSLDLLFFFKNQCGMRGEGREGVLLRKEESGAGKSSGKIMDT